MPSENLVQGLYITSVTIDGDTFGAISTRFDVATRHDGSGMPLMGSQSIGIQVVIDMHDDGNLPFSMVQKLFELSHEITREKIKNIKIVYWKDESHQDALSTFSFQGWISHFNITSGQNHTLTLSLQPALDSKQFVKLDHGN
jgi:hypothetical protein